MQRSGKSPKAPTRPNDHDAPTPNGTNLSLMRLNSMEEEEEQESRHRGKKVSVLAKVKQRARKWRQFLYKKRHPSPGNSNTAPSWQPSFDDDGHRNVEDDDEFFGTPMHEFEQEPEEQKETARSGQHILGGTDSTVFEKDVLLTNKCRYSPTNEPNRGIPPLLDKASTEAIASEAEISEEDEEEEEEEEQEWASPREVMKCDKGVSVKEYLMDKLRPGEEDRALSRAISEAINPRRSTDSNNGGGLVGKFRYAVASLFLRKEEPPFTPVCANPHDLVEERKAK